MRVMSYCAPQDAVGASTENHPPIRDSVFIHVWPITGVMSTAASAAACAWIRAFWQPNDGRAQLLLLKIEPGLILRVDFMR